MARVSALVGGSFDKNSPRKHSRSPIAFKKPRLEFLEDRTLLSTYNATIFTDSNTAGAGSLRDAIIAANGDNTSANVINLSAGTYQLSLRNPSTGQQANAQTGALAITNTNETLTIIGQGVSSTFINAGSLLDRVFQVNPNAHLILQNLTIEGGYAQDNGTVGALPGATAALGGGILNNGGNVTLSNVAVNSNSAAGGAGQNAEGGGIYSSGGSLSLNNVSLQHNKAQGGYGVGGTATARNGGIGGNAQGGAIPSPVEDRVAAKSKWNW